MLVRCFLFLHYITSKRPERYSLLYIPICVLVEFSRQVDFHSRWTVRRLADCAWLWTGMGKTNRVNDIHYCMEETQHQMCVHRKTKKKKENELAGNQKCVWLALRCGWPLTVLEEQENGEFMMHKSTQYDSPVGCFAIKYIWLKHLIAPAKNYSRLVFQWVSINQDNFSYGISPAVKFTATTLYNSTFLDSSSARILLNHIVTALELLVSAHWCFHINEYENVPLGCWNLFVK